MQNLSFLDLAFLMLFFPGTGVDYYFLGTAFIDFSHTYKEAPLPNNNFVDFSFSMNGAPLASNVVPA